MALTLAFTAGDAGGPVGGEMETVEKARFPPADSHRTV